MNTFLGIIISIIALFLIFLVLIQKGKGGGLAGAFGAPGGASAFGTKAGDMFMYITIVVAGVWISACVFTIWWTHPPSLIGSTNPNTPVLTSDGPDKDSETNATNAADDDTETEEDSE
jgi:preprotein translocase subunit SecG